MFWNKKNNEEIIKTSIGDFSRTSLKGKEDMITREFALLIDKSKEENYKEIQRFINIIGQVQTEFNPYKYRYHYVDELKVELYNICNGTINEARQLKEDLIDNNDLVEERDNIIKKYC